jgi:hypothetical protein
MGYLDALTALLKKCRGKARAARGDETIRAMWQERGARVCLIMASQLIEMKVCSSFCSQLLTLTGIFFVGFCSSRSPSRAAHETRPQCLNVCSPIIYSANISPRRLPRQSLAAFRGGRGRFKRKSGSKEHECRPSCQCARRLAQGKRIAQESTSC